MNSEAISNRIKLIIEHYNLTSSTFADSIDVQRSSISHLLSGRNKPSLDFVMKVVNNYEDVDLYWLLYGDGNFPKKDKKTESFKKEVTKSAEDLTFLKAPTLFTDNKIITQSDENKSNSSVSVNNKKLVKVILIYNDETFEEFNK
ncbi:helix-turn-helix transcriptional regulator [Tenacibaculum geojense]|uniref:Helix-turn-helix transcriptional regulator n=1 Tax=Tenacibaculum geojense TaxID=915352 RepID=A0ABW3JR59_9FLAO